MAPPSYWTPAQWKTFYAFTSAVVQPVAASDLKPVTDNLSPPVLEAFASSAADENNEVYVKALEHVLESYVASSARDGMGVVLSMLNSVPGCLLLTFSTTPFHEQPLAVREELICGWANAATTQLFPPIRGFTVSCMAIVRMVWMRCEQSKWQPALEYSDLTAAGKLWTEEQKEEGFHKFEFMDPTKCGPEELEFDVVIVGSGCGGAVMAKKCAEAGLKTLVVEKGSWIPTDQLPLSEHDAMTQLFENGLYWASEDGSVALIAGKTFGGGGVVNWNASLQTQSYVRDDWATNHNLPFFLSQDYQACLDRVCARMGVSSAKIQHNDRNALLLEGGRKLGYHGVTVPQNATADHQCGYCTYGCGGAPGSRKMGTTQTFLPDAACAGCKFIQNFQVSTILFSDATKSRATGIAGTWGGTPVNIKAKSVVVSCGSLNSPVLLQRSGLKNPNIGRNLHLHPANCVFAEYDHPTHPMSGSALTSAITSFEHLDAAGHGVKLETPVMNPSFLFPAMAFRGAKEWKQDILGFQRMNMFIDIHREAHPGRVEASPSGRAKIIYTPHKEDRDMMMKGIVALCKLIFLSGATKIISPVHGYPVFYRNSTSTPPPSPPATDTLELEDPGVLDPAFAAWLDGLGKTGLPCPGSQFGSAHQMGSCKMSDREGSGVVDSRGRVWGTAGLYVADASVMPSACGVNPMVTTMAISDWIAGHVVDELKGR